MIKRIFCLAALTLLALFTWWVLWFMLLGAITPEDEILVTVAPALEGSGQAAWTLLPSWPTLQPLVQLLLDTPVFFGMFWNACKLVFPQVAGQLLAATPAAWAFSKLQFPGKKLPYGVYLLLMVLPFQITMVPNYLVLNKLGLMDTPWAVILPGIFSTFPVFIIKKGFDGIPDSLLEAAALDGAGPLKTFFWIGLPLGMPAILSAATLDFIEAWNAIEQPMMFLQDRSNWPLSLYLSNITVEDLGLAMAASLMMLAPPLLLFLAGQNIWSRALALLPPLVMECNDMNLREEMNLLPLTRRAGALSPEKIAGILRAAGASAARPSRWALRFFAVMVVLTLIARGTSGAAMPKVSLTNPAGGPSCSRPPPRLWLPQEKGRSSPCRRGSQ